MSVYCQVHYTHARVHVLLPYIIKAIYMYTVMHARALITQ